MSNNMCIIKGDISGNNTAKKKVQKKKKINTEWYRKNKKERNVVHTCSHCDYSTTGPKIILTNHIYSKHTEEKDRPFQCSYDGCSRGFAQKGSLKKHMEKVHKEIAKDENSAENNEISLEELKNQEELEEKSNEPDNSETSQNN